MSNLDKALRYIDKLYFKKNLPPVQEIGTRFYLPSTALADHKGNTINSLMQALQVITKDTQYEEICNEIIKKSQDVLEYCERNSN